MLVRLNPSCYNYDKKPIPKFTKNEKLIKSLISDLGGWGTVAKANLEYLRSEINTMLRKGYLIKQVSDEQIKMIDKPKIKLIGEKISDNEYKKIGQSFKKAIKQLKRSSDE